MVDRTKQPGDAYLTVRIACEQALVWVLCTRCETRVAKPRERGVPTSPHALAASPLASRISRMKPKREPARRLQ